MKFKRCSGIILHPSSLPGPDGIGDLGPEAYRWIDFLDASGCSIWQLLPLGPTGYGDSPYQCFSAFAGNPYLVSPDLLIEDGLINQDDLLSKRPDLPDIPIDYGRTINWKLYILDQAYDRFKSNPVQSLNSEFEVFQQKEVDWLEPYCLFMAIKDIQNGKSWSNWPEPLRKRHPETICDFKQHYSDQINRHAFRQFIFYRQWTALKNYANKKNIQILGDVPIFVAYDSADTWSHPDLFFLDAEGLPIFVAGVPPDYFSPTGQLWGNPLYRWEIHRVSGYNWWIERLKSSLMLFDIIRLDHFRGFVAYWEIPAGLPTAEVGKWVQAPGVDFFNKVREYLGDIPIIIEDLGFITPDVISLRKKLNYPGMKILQFAFSTDATDPFLPHNYPTNCVSYTGTHDNDTARGWYETAPESEKDFCRRYLASSGKNIPWDMIRAIWSSVAVIAIAPFQDFLGLHSDARMNFPGNTEGNWGWRLPKDALGPELVKRISEINSLYGRPLPEKLSVGH